MLANYKIRKMVLIGFFANILEWYDFSIYAYLASIMGSLFFPETDGRLALLKSFFVFSISFLIRPIGSIFFGYIADQYGRRISLRLSLVMMAIPTFFIGLLPTYNVAGYYTVGMLILLRMIQGFAAGGELPTSSCYMYEISPDSRRNFFCSFVPASSILGVFSASFVVNTMYWLLSDHEINNWGWRVPFLMTAIIAITIFKIRNSIEESSKFSYDSTEFKNTTYVELVKKNKNEIALVFILNTFVSIAFYLLFVWMPSYLQVFVEINPTFAHLVASFNLLILILTTLFVGYVSKDHQIKNWLISGIFLVTVLAYPLFNIFSHKNLFLIFIAQFIFAISLGCVDGVINAVMGSLFEDRIRCIGISLGFTFATAIFGGLSPTICSFLIYKTGSNLSPVIFLVASGIVAMLVLINIKNIKLVFLHR